MKVTFDKKMSDTGQMIYPDDRKKFAETYLIDNQVYAEYTDIPAGDIKAYSGPWPPLAARDYARYTPAEFIAEIGVSSYIACIDDPDSVIRFLIEQVKNARSVDFSDPGNRDALRYLIARGHIQAERFESIVYQS